MKSITYYDTTTGEILYTMIGSDFEIRENMPPRSSYVEGKIDHNKYYVSNGVVADKKTMVVNIQGNVIKGLPNPTSVTVEDKVYEVTDGEFEFTSNLPGPYRLILKSPQYLTREVQLP